MKKMSGAKKSFIVFLFVVAIALWEGFGAYLFSYPIVNFPPQGGRILVWGDSLSVGVGASSGEHGYISVLKERLSLDIVNKAVSGETTSGTLLHSVNDLTEIKPNIVMVLLGGNDVLLGVPPTETMTNLRTLITAAQKTNAVVYLIGFQKHEGDVYTKGFKSLARDTGSLYTKDILGDIIGNSTLMSDEIHPNDKGYLKMADKIAPSIESLVLSVKLNLATTTK